MLKRPASINSAVTPGLMLLMSTGASPFFLSHFLNLVSGVSPAVLYIHNLGRKPRKTLFGSGRMAFSTVVFISLLLMLVADSSSVSAPV